MKFRLLEKVFDTFKEGTGTYFIYLNPTTQELRAKDESRGNRAIIDPEGNLYMEAKWEDDGEGVVYSDWIHQTLIDVLQDAGLFKELSNDWQNNPWDLYHGFCVQRRGASFDFFMAESYELEDTKEVDEIIKKTLGLARQKNPSLKFHEKNILDAGYKEEE